MLIKKIAACAAALAIILSLAMPVFAQEQDTARISMPTMDIPCKNAILISTDTGQVLYEKNADQSVPIASITKVMTLLLTFEAIDSGKISLQDKVPVSTHAYEMGGSQIWLEPGEEFTLDEMIKAICVSSANDAAVAVAEFVGGSEPVFAEMMNKKAQELGMKNSVFKNACGLDEEGHLSSARDVSIMSRELLKHERIFNYSTIWMDSLRGGKTQLVNTNKLLKNYAGINGLKTGTTSGAGVCISASAKRDNMSLLAVVLGSGNGKDRFVSATQLLDYGFSTYEIAAFPPMEQAVKVLPVALGAQKQVELEYQTPELILLKKGESSKITASAVVEQRLQAPVTAGTKVGEVSLMLDNTQLATYPICVKTQVDKMNFTAGMRLLLDALIRL